MTFLILFLFTIPVPFWLKFFTVNGAESFDCSGAVLHLIGCIFEAFFKWPAELICLGGNEDKQLFF